MACQVWSLTDFTCLRTLEGHVSSVLRVHWVSAGLQLLSSGSDGLVKLWSAKTAECVTTLDAHEALVYRPPSRGYEHKAMADELARRLAKAASRAATISKTAA